MTLAAIVSRKTLFLVALTLSLALTGCSCLSRTYVDRIHMTQKPTTQAEIDKNNAEFNEISDQGFFLTKRWEDKKAAKPLEYWHFRRPTRPSDQAIAPSSAATPGPAQPSAEAKEESKN